MIYSLELIIIANTKYNMYEFKTFDTGKNSFLNKTKVKKAKKDEDIKKSQSILLIQKKIRAFLIGRKYAIDEYPLLIKNIRNNSDILYIRQFWKSVHTQPQILQQHFLSITIRAFMKDMPIQIDQNKFLSLVESKVQFLQKLSIKQYQFFLARYSSQIQRSFLNNLMSNSKSKEAINLYIKGNIHILVDLASQFDRVQEINDIMKCFYENSQLKNKMEIQIIQDLERVLMSFNKAVLIYQRIIKQNQEELYILEILQITMNKLKDKYIEMIVNKFPMSRKLLFSKDSEDIAEEFFKQKQEWSIYQQKIGIIKPFIEHILNNFLNNCQDINNPALNIVITYMKISDSFIKTNITTQHFLLLLKRLETTSFYVETHNLKFDQLLLTIVLLQKYVDNINDLNFIKKFQFCVEMLQKSIKNCLVKFMKSIITFNNNNTIVNEVLKHSTAFMNNLYNKIFRTNLLKTTIFQDQSLRIFQKNYNFANYGNKQFINNIQKISERSPYLLPIESRFLMFKRLVSFDGEGNYYYNNYHLKIKRGQQFENGFAQLYKKDIRSHFRVTFIDQFQNQQSGIDAGGLTKEFLNRMFKTAFSPLRGLFIQNDKKQLLPNPDYEILMDQKIAQYYEFVGQLLGKSLYSNIMLGVKFAGPFLNMLANKRNTFDDLLQIDSQLYNSLTYILEMHDDHIQDLELTFQFHDSLNKKIVNLLPNGDKIKLTKNNKQEYVNLLINYKVNRSLQRQTKYIRKGLRQVIKQSWLNMFNYAELNYLLSGAGVIDVDDWMKYTKVCNNNPIIIGQFWQVVRSFNQNQKSLLLKFVTSNQRPSFLGFKDLNPSFTINIVKQKQNALPISHTCVNVLELPQYNSIQLMREKILYAIKADAGFNFA